MDICFPVPLGSIPELPAESCHEIKASEGENAVSGRYWFYSIVPDKVALAHCDMGTEGNLNYEHPILIYMSTKVTELGKLAMHISHD